MSRRRTYLVVVAGIFALAILHRVALGPALFPVDDAYITLHNAEALLAGEDPNFLGISPLTGATSAVHLALTALLSIPFGGAPGLYLAMWVGALVYATGIVRLAFAWGARPWLALLLVVLGLVVARVPHQLLNGLETGLALGAVTWALALASERGRERPLGVICGVMPFLRPELGALALGLLAVKGWPLWREGRRRELGLMLLFALAGAAPWLLWALVAMGSLLPTTAGAKIAWFAEGGLSGSVKREWVAEDLAEFVTTIGIVALAAVALPFVRAGRAVLAFAVILVAFYYIQFPGALGHYEQRYLYVLLPGLLLGLMWALSRRSGWLPRVALVVAVASLVQAAVLAPGRWEQHLAGRDFTRNELRSVAVWADLNLPPDSKVLVHDAGSISYNTRFRLVDLVGLKTPRVVRFHEELTLPSAGARRGEAINRIALQERPQYLIVLDGWDRIFRITEALRAHGWVVALLRPGAYSVYALTPPGEAPPPPPPPPPS